MRSGILSVATCQFPIGADVRRNGTAIRRQMVRAHELGAEVVHFPEGALSGYAGPDIETWEAYDWALLREETESVVALAKSLGIWVVLGTAHPLSDGHLPHNSLYVISPKGRIVERYDKSFCTDGDLKHYSPGDHLSMVTINGVECGFLICYDVRFPELYRQYKKRGAEMIFQSFYNARAKGPTIHTTIMRPSLQCRAATNYLWISAANSSAYYGSWPSVFVRPDGVIAGQLRFHRAGVIVNTANTNEQLYDASKAYRDLAINGALHNGEAVDDPRSRDRTCL
jgi:predicted amidohydrolase